MLLRPLRGSDASVFASWSADPEFCVEVDWSIDLSRERHRAFWEEMIAAPPADLIRLAAVVDDRVVGYVDLHGDGANERELGFVIGERAKWGRGLGAQAARAGLRYGFTELGLNSIWAEAVNLNVRSIRVLERVGMAETGVGDAASFRGQPSHYRRFAISATEWAGHTEAETQ